MDKDKPPPRPAGPTPNQNISAASKGWKGAIMAAGVLKSRSMRGKTETASQQRMAASQPQFVIPVIPSTPAEKSIMPGSTPDPYIEPIVVEDEPLPAGVGQPIKLTSAIFTPFYFEWRWNISPDKLMEIQYAWLSTVKTIPGLTDVPHVLIISTLPVTPVEPLPQWHVLCYASEKSVERKPDESLPIAQETPLYKPPVDEIIRFLVPQQGLLYRLLESFQNSSRVLSMDGAFVLTNAICRAFGFLERVAPFRPLSWTSQDLVEYIKLTGGLLMKSDNPEIQNSLRARYNQAIRLASHTVAEADFSACVTAEERSALLSQLLPFANAGSAELYLLVVNSLIRSAEGSFLASESLLESIASVLRTGACHVLLWPETQTKIQTLKEMVTKIWKNIQSQFTDILSQDQVVLQYYFLTILSALIDFAVSLNLEGLKDEFVLEIEQHKKRYAGTRQAYDIEFLSRYYSAGLTRIGTDKSQAAHALEKIKLVIEFVGNITSFASVTFNLDNLITGVDAGITLIKSAITTTQTLVGTPGIGEWYQRIRLIRSMLDMLTREQFQKIFSNIRYVDSFLSVIIPRSSSPMSIKQGPMDELFAVLLCLEPRLVSSDIRDCIAATLALDRMRIIINSREKTPVDGNPAQESWKDIISTFTNESEVLLDKLQSLYDIMENHALQQIEQIQSSVKDPKSNPLVSSQLREWTALKDGVIKSRSFIKNRKPTTVGEKSIRVVDVLPLTVEDTQTVFLCYNRARNDLSYTIGLPSKKKGETRTVKSFTGIIHSAGSTIEQCQTLGLLKIEPVKILPERTATEYNTFYLLPVAQKDLVTLVRWTIKYISIDNGTEIKTGETPIITFDLPMNTFVFPKFSKKLTLDQLEILTVALLGLPELAGVKVQLMTINFSNPKVRQILGGCIEATSANMSQKLIKKGKCLWISANQFFGQQVQKQALRFSRSGPVSTGFSLSLVENAFKKNFSLAYDIEQLLQQQQSEITGESQASALGRELSNYIPAEVTYQHSPDPKPDELKALDLEVKEFLDNPDSCLFILQGDSGMGKSLFLRYLEDRQWACYDAIFKDYDNTIIPVYVPLANLANPYHRCVQQALEQKGFTSESIWALMHQKSDLEGTPRVIILLDGYDELGTRRNIIESNDLLSWKGAKIFLTSRIGYISSSSYQNYFQTRSHKNAFFVCERYLAPFTDLQQRRYLERRVTKSRAMGEETWSVETYERRFQRTAVLRNLAQTPFILSILVQVLPELPKEDINLTRAKIFRQFLSYWFRNAEHRLEKQNLPEKYNLQGTFNNYTQELAKEMWLDNRVTVSYKRPGFKPLGSSKSKWLPFFGNKQVNVDAWVGYTGAPVRTVNEKVRFIHKSVQEYAIGKALFVEITSYLRQLRRHPDHTFPLESSFNQKYLGKDREIVKFMGEMILDFPERKTLCDTLLSIIHQSKIDQQGDKLKHAASNAMTVLNSIKFPFCGHELLDVNIPYSVLDNGNFYRTNFSGSNLQGVCFARSYLVESIFSGCSMAEVDMQAFPNVQWDRQITSFSVLSTDKIQNSRFIAGVDQKRSVVYYVDLEKIAHKTIILQTPQQSEIKSINFSPNGTNMITVNKKDMMHRWDLSAPEPQPVMFGQLDADIMHQGFTPDGSRFVVADFEGLSIWDTTVPEPKGTPLTDHQCWWQSVIMSPSGRSFVTTGTDGSIFVWDLAQTPPKGTALKLEGGVQQTSYTPNGAILVTTDKKGDIILWDMNNNLESITLNGQTGVTVFSFANEGRNLLSIDAKGSIFIWDMTVSPPVGQAFSSHTTSPIKQFVLSPDGRVVVAIDKKNSMFYWDRTAPAAQGIALTGHKAEIVHVAFSSDSLGLISGDKNGIILSFDLTQPQAPGQLLLQERGGVLALWYNPKHPQRVMILSGFGINQLDVKLASSLQNTDNVHITPIFRVGLAPNNKPYGVTVSDGKSAVWDIKTGKAILRSGQEYPDYPISSAPYFNFHTIDDDQLLILQQDRGVYSYWNLESSPLAAKLTVEVQAIITTFLYSPDESTLVSGDDRGGLFFWDLSLSAPQGTLQALHHAPITVIKFSKDGQVLASADKSGNVILWKKNVDNRYIGFPLSSQVKQGNICNLSFNSDGRFLVSGDYKNIICWQINIGDLIKADLLWSQEDVTSHVFHPNGQLLVAITKTNNLLCWNVSDPTSQKAFAEARPDISHFFFSPDGRFLIETDRKGAIHLWDMFASPPTDTLLVSHQAAVTQIAFSPDSNTLVSGDIRGNIFCWDMTVSPPVGVSIGKRPAMIQQIAFTPDGKILVIGDKEAGLTYWMMTKPYSTESKSLVGHRGSISHLCFSPKGHFLVSADFMQKGLYLWDLSLPSPVCEPLKGLQANARDVSFTPNGESLINRW